MAHLLAVDQGTTSTRSIVFDHDSAYIFQNPDRRVMFAIPFETDFTLIGTTDEDFKSDVNTVAPSNGEIKYLCEAAMVYFRQAVSPDDVVWAFAGVRALYDDGSSKPEDTTRDYHLDLDKHYGEAPLLTVFGGKITTYRRLAESALQMLSPFFAMGAAWTSRDPLPGGNIPVDGVDAFITRTREQRPFLSAAHARRLVHAYGTRLDDILGNAKSLEDLGENFGADLTAAEARYLMQREWAEDVDDILWRRSKLGLKLSADERVSLVRFMAQSRSSMNAAE
ncbi:MAG: FAD-dependent oxidoreductase [Pseudorhodoplanes sp.]